jgi:hypothetical protein
MLRRNYSLHSKLHLIRRFGKVRRPTGGYPQTGFEEVWVRTTKAPSMRARVSEPQVVVRTWIQLRIENPDDFL